LKTRNSPQKRTRALYNQGLLRRLIKKRIRSNRHPRQLTDEWKKRGVKEQREYAILTAEISKAAFGSRPANTPPA